MADLLETEDHPQQVQAEIDGARIVTMDSARYVDARNTDTDVVVAASYLGVLPARLMVPHRPRGVIGHDACGAKDGSGIAGLWFLEALGLPGATADGWTAELGNGQDLYDEGVINHVNLPAESCGVHPGMSVQEAAHLLATRRPGEAGLGTRIRREVKETGPDGRSVIVTDSIIFAQDEDRGRNVLVTAGHTGRSGASFLLEFAPWGFICSDGGRAKNDSGISGLTMVEAHGLPGASTDARTAAMGDAFDAYEHGLIGACNDLARAKGVHEGQPVREAASCLLAETSMGGTRLREGPVDASDAGLGRSPRMDADS